MENEQEQDALEVQEDLELEEEETVEEPKPKKEYTVEQKLARVDRMREKYLKELGRDSKPEPEVKATKSDLDLGGIAYLNSMVGLKGKDEIALAREYVSNGKAILDLPDNKYFKQDLEALREARTSQEAVPKSTKRSTTPQADDFQTAFATYRETGKLPEDRALREKVVDAAVEREKGKGAFSDQPIIYGGNQLQ